MADILIYIVVGSHNITLLDGLPTEIIKKNAKVSVYEPVVLRTLEGTIIRSSSSIFGL
jgi:hypothetical protein